MDKRKIINCFTVFVLIVALAGIFYYISYVNGSSTAKKGTLVRTFSQKVDECRI